MIEKLFKCINISANGMTGLFWLGKDQISVYDVLKILNDLSEENEQLKQQLLENNCDNCKYSKAIYADVECRKKGLTPYKFNCNEFKGDDCND